MYLPRIVITSGEPAGIGPDSCVALAQSDWDCDVVVAGDAELLAAAANALSLPLRIERYDPSTASAPHRAGILKVMHMPTARAVTAGRLDPRNAAYVIGMLERACDGCMNGEFAAMVTAPVQKSTLMEAGYAFTGHTEYLAARTRAALPVMLLISDRLRVAPTRETYCQPPESTRHRTSQQAAEAARPSLRQGLALPQNVSTLPLRRPPIDADVGTWRSGGI